MQEKNILLTGASGFLGNYIKNEFAISSIVYSIGRSTSNNVENIIANIANEIPLLPDVFFEKVIHIAGKAHIFPKTEEEKKDFYTVNVQGTKNLLFSLEKLSSLPKQFIFISTVAVYGKNEGILIDEDFPTNPNTPYGDSKLQAEKVIQDWCAKKNVNCLILRLPLIAGENPPGNLGDMKKVILKGTYVKIIGNKAQKSVVVAKDVAKLIQSMDTSKKGIYHLTDGIHPTFEAIESAMSVRLNKKIHITLPLFLLKAIGKIGDLMTFIIKKDMPISTLRLQKITSTLTFDDSKAIRELNWKPQNSIDFIKEKI
jgi:nucleoside-diphosphate-sugar epimerase